MKPSGEIDKILDDYEEILTKANKLVYSDKDD